MVFVYGNLFLKKRNLVNSTILGNPEKQFHSAEEYTINSMMISMRWETEIEGIEFNMCNDTNHTDKNVEDQTQFYWI